jgi:UDPglucose 6-dehydrogenase
MRLCVVGAGYVGLVTGACFADFGHSVVCVDSDRSKIDTLANGGVPIFEPGLEALIDSNVDAERLSFSADLAAGVRGADALFIAVGTPSRDTDGWPDLSSIFTVARNAARWLEDDAVVVVKSTVPIGTGDEVERIIAEARPEASISTVSNPEFLRAGSAIRDFRRPDRVVVGAEESRARDLMRDIYAPLIARNTPILFTSRRSSELIKYSANALLATKVAFINEVAELCERADADVLEVARGVGLDERIGTKFLAPGPGFGGSCFRKDALALARMGESHEAPMRIVEAVLHANECRKRAMVRKVAAALDKPLRAATIAVLGLTFKANTDDMREAPSITLVSELIEAGARVRAYDPAGMESAKSVLPREVTYAKTAYEAANRADAVVLMTEWPEFRNLDLGRIARSLNAPVIVDLRNLYEAEDLLDEGLQYHGIGRPALRPDGRNSLTPKVRPAGEPKTNGANGHNARVRNTLEFADRAAPGKWAAPARREEARMGTNGRRGV